MIRNAAATPSPILPKSPKPTKTLTCKMIAGLNTIVFQQSAGVIEKGIRMTISEESSRKASQMLILERLVASLDQQ